MTYKDLLHTLQSINPDRLNDTVTVYNPYEDEYIAAVDTNISDDETNDVLDPGHLFLVLKA